MGMPGFVVDFLSTYHPTGDDGDAIHTLVEVEHLR